MVEGKNDIKMNGHKILDLPTSDSEPVMKGYADTDYSSGGGGGQRGPKGDKGDTGDAGKQGEIGLTGPKGDKGDTGSQGPKGDKGDKGDTGDAGKQGEIGLTGPKGDKGDTGSQGPKGDTGAQGPKGDKGDVGNTGLRGPKGQKGDVGNKGITGDPGRVGPVGPRGLQGPQGLTGPRGRKGDKGDKGDVGLGFTSSGVTMSGNIDMGDNKITNLKTPTNNTDAATKKYVDDNEPKFKDGNTATKDVDLRESSGDLEFYDEVTFKNKAKCKDLTVISTQDEIVNKNSLETGKMVGIQSLDTTLKDLLTNSTKHELLVMKGKPGTSSIIYKHYSINGNPTLTADASAVTLDIFFNNDLPKGIYKYVFDLHFSRSYNIKVFLYGECGGVGYNASSVRRVVWQDFHAASTRRAISTRHAWILSYKSARVSTHFSRPHA